MGYLKSMKDDAIQGGASVEGRSMKGSKKDIDK